MNQSKETFFRTMQEQFQEIRKINNTLPIRVKMHPDLLTELKNDKDFVNTQPITVKEKDPEIFGIPIEEDYKVLTYEFVYKEGKI